MVDGRRAEMRRMGQEQESQYKRTLAFVIFLLVSLMMITATFLNPLFMKGQVRTSYNKAVVVRQMNVHFDTLADLVDAEHDQGANLLTAQQTEPIADHIIDYTVGIHGFNISTMGLARNILHDIDQNISKGTSSDAQEINQRLRREKGNAPYLVAQAFNLNVIMLGSNLALLLLLVNVIIVIVTIATLVSLIRDLRGRCSGKELLHEVTAAGMWAGFWLILLCGLLALVPIMFNVESLPGLGYLLEISSSIFLDFVIAGVIMYVISAIPWQATTTN